MPPGEEVSEGRLANVAKALGVDAAVLTQANQEVLQTYPRYGAQPGDAAFNPRRVAMPNVGRVVAEALKKKTIRVSPKLAKSTQRVVRANTEFLASGLQNANGLRDRGTEVHPNDVNNFTMVNTVEALGHLGKRKATETAFNGDITRRPHRR